MSSRKGPAPLECLVVVPGEMRRSLVGSPTAGSYNTRRAPCGASNNCLWEGLKMPGFRPLRCLVLPIVAAALLPVGAKAAPSLAQAIKQADAKYLELKDLDVKPVTPNIEAGSGEEETEPTSREIALGPLKAALSYRQEGSGEEAMHHPRRHRVRRRQADRRARGRRHRHGRSAGQRADRRDRSRQFQPGSRGVVLYRRRPLLLRHQGHLREQGWRELEDDRARSVRRRTAAWQATLPATGTRSSRPATTPSSTPLAAMPARPRRSRSSP